MGDKDTDLESVEYSPIAHLDELFRSPSALLELDDLIFFTNTYKQKLDLEIDTRRSKYNEDSVNANSTLSAIEIDLNDLIIDMENTKKLAKTTERTINSMTHNIKKLDNCKKNVTLSMTILKRLQMLITSYNNVEHIIYNSNNKDYYEIYQLLSVVLEFMDHFQSYKSIDDINNLNKKVNSLKTKIVDEIFNDFDKELNQSRSNMELLNACKILDLLGNSYHDKLLNWFINNQLKEIQSIFKSTEEAGSLENLSRRYIFFRRVFKNVELRYSSKFPSEWNILYQLSDRFCYFTKQDLKEVLQKESKNINVNLLLNSLSETLEFENFLNMKFKFKNILVNKNINQEKKEINFDKQISSVFEPYLNVWLDHQEKIINDKFLEFLNPSKLLENNDGSDEHHEQDENSLNILTSSADLFRIYRSLLSQLSKLSTGEPLLKLSAIFVKYLNKYHDLILKPIIPDFKTIKNNNEEENQQVLTYACLVLNTADYCSLTISQLQERLTSLINEKFSSKVEQNFSKVKEVFMQLINECLNLLVFKISEDLSLQWRTMINLNWKNLNSVEDSSSYTSDISKTINSNCIVIFEKINRVIYTKNFMNKLVELISYSFLINMIKLKPINEVMSEQFLLDIQVLKKNLINLPELYKQQEELSSKAYIRFINQSLGNIENILKLLLIQFKPIDNFVMNYFFIIGDRNFNNFIKILKIKGILPTSAQNINFNRVELSKYSKTFEEKLTKYEDNLIDADDNNISTGNGNKSLVGSLKFLENLNVDQIDYNYDNYPPWLINSKTSTNSVASPNSPALKGFPSISIPFGNTPSNNNSNNNNNNNTSNNSNSTTANGQNGGEPIKNLITRKDAVEKNLAKTIDNMKFNDNFKNFGKFFKRND